MSHPPRSPRLGMSGSGSGAPTSKRNYEQYERDNDQEEEQNDGERTKRQRGNSAERAGPSTSRSAASTRTGAVPQPVARSDGQLESDVSRGAGIDDSQTSTSLSHSSPVITVESDTNEIPIPIPAPSSRTTPETAHSREERLRASLERSATFDEHIAALRRPQQTLVEDDLTRPVELRIASHPAQVPWDPEPRTSHDPSVLSSSLHAPLSSDLDSVVLEPGNFQRGSPNPPSNTDLSVTDAGQTWRLYREHVSRATEHLHSAMELLRAPSSSSPSSTSTRHPIQTTIEEPNASPPLAAALPSLRVLGLPNTRENDERSWSSGITHRPQRRTSLLTRIDPAVPSDNASTNQANRHTAWLDNLDLTEVRRLPSQLSLHTEENERTSASPVLRNWFSNPSSSSTVRDTDRTGPSSSAARPPDPQRVFNDFPGFTWQDSYTGNLPRLREVVQRDEHRHETAAPSRHEVLRGRRSFQDIFERDVDNSDRSIRTLYNDSPNFRRRARSPDISRLHPTGSRSSSINREPTLDSSRPVRPRMSERVNSPVRDQETVSSIPPLTRPMPARDGSEDSDEDDPWTASDPSEVASRLRRQAEARLNRLMNDFDHSRTLREEVRDGSRPSLVTFSSLDRIPRRGQPTLTNPAPYEQPSMRADIEWGLQRPQSRSDLRASLTRRTSSPFQRFGASAPVGLEDELQTAHDTAGLGDNVGDAQHNLRAVQQPLPLPGLFWDTAINEVGGGRAVSTSRTRRDLNLEGGWRSDARHAIAPHLEQGSVTNEGGWGLNSSATQRGAHTEDAWGEAPSLSGRPPAFSDVRRRNTSRERGSRSVLAEARRGSLSSTGGWDTTRSDSRSISNESGWGTASARREAPATETEWGVANEDIRRDHSDTQGGVTSSRSLRNADFSDSGWRPNSTAFRPTSHPRSGSSGGVRVEPPPFAGIEPIVGDSLESWGEERIIDRSDEDRLSVRDNFRSFLDGHESRVFRRSPSPIPLPRPSARPPLTEANSSAVSAALTGGPSATTFRRRTGERQPIDLSVFHDGPFRATLTRQHGSEHPRTLPTSRIDLGDDNNSSNSTRFPRPPREPVRRREIAPLAREPSEEMQLPSLISRLSDPQTLSDHNSGLRSNGSSSRLNRENHIQREQRDMQSILRRRLRSEASDIAEDPTGRDEGFSRAVDALRTDGLSMHRERQLVDRYRRDRAEERNTREEGVRSQWGEITEADSDSASHHIPRRSLTSRIGARRGYFTASSDELLPFPSPPGARPMPTWRHRGTSFNRDAEPEHERERDSEWRHLRLRQRLRMQDHEALLGARGLMNFFNRGGHGLGDFVRDEDFDPSYEGLLRLTAQLGEVRPRVTSEEMIASLPQGTFREWKCEGCDQRCPICLEDYVLEDNLMRLSQCSHWLHRDCLQEWLRNARTCPVCRKDVQPPTRTRSRTPVAGPSNPRRPPNPNDEDEEPDSAAPNTSTDFDSSAGPRFG